MYNQFTILEIKRYLAAHGLSRSQFAELVGVSESSLNKVLSGHLTPSDKLLAKMEARVGLGSTLGMRIRNSNSGALDTYAIKNIEGEYQVIQIQDSMNRKILLYKLSILTDSHFDETSFEFKYNINNDLTEIHKKYYYKKNTIAIICDRINYFSVMMLYIGNENRVYSGKICSSFESSVTNVIKSNPVVLQKITSDDRVHYGSLSEEDAEFAYFYDLFEVGQQDGLLPPAHASS